MSVLFAFALAAAANINSDGLAVQAVHNLGSCIVNQLPSGAAEQLLAMDYRSAEYEKKLRGMIKGHGRCLNPGDRISLSGVLGAGAIAEAVLNEHVKTDEMPQRLAYDPARPAIPARSPTETMALCTVLTAPQATARLLATTPATPEESAALSTISPVLVDCLKKDVKLTVNKPALRALLALAAWRIASTPKLAAQ
jgi:hypothetical protein